MTNANQALVIAQQSPYPISSGGDGIMFACSLFAVLCISFLLLMRAISTGRQLWVERHCKERGMAFWFRWTIMLICFAGLLGKVPDAVYKISFGEVSTHTLHTILTVREWANSVAFAVVTGWIGILSYFEPAWIIRLSNVNNRVYGTYDGNKSQFHRFIFIVFLTGLLAGAIALSKASS